MNAECVESLHSHDHRERERRNDQSGKTRIHQRQSVGPPASKFEPEENGWEALPLAAKELTRLFPELWRTRTAAEDWRRKNPLTPILSIIRVWGVLNTYRPKGQRSWSRALVRHGADARVALAGVLGIPADDIRLRDRPDPPGGS